MPLGVTKALADYAQAVLAQVKDDAVGQFSLAAHIQGITATDGTERL
jgi:hypothetical protein